MILRWFLAGTLWLIPVLAAASEMTLMPVVRAPERGGPAETAVSAAVEAAVAKSSRYTQISLDAALGSTKSIAARKEIAAAIAKVKKGRIKFIALDLEDSMALLEDAVKAFRGNAAYTADLKPAAEALMLLGAIYLLLGDDGVGTTHLADAIAIDQGLEPDPTAFNDGMRELYSQTQSSLAEARGKIEVKSKRPAHVYIDGRHIGETPVVVENLIEGPHYVRAVADGFESWGKIVSVVAGDTVTARANVKPLKAYKKVQPALDAVFTPERSPQDVAALCKELSAQRLLLVSIDSASEKSATVRAELYAAPSGVLLAATALPVPLGDEKSTLQGVRDLLTAFAPPSFVLGLGRITTKGIPAKAATGQLNDALSSYGSEISALDPTLNDGCFNDPPCLKKASEGVEDLSFVVRVSANKSGKFQIEVFDTEGKPADKITLTATGEGAPRKRRLDARPLVEKLWERLAKEKGPTEAVATPTSDTVAATEPNGETSGTDTAEVADGAKGTEGDKGAMTPPKVDEEAEGGGGGVAGWVMVGLGAAVAGGGGALLGTQLPIRDDPAALGPARQDAQVLGLTGFGMAIGGGVIAVVGLIVAIASN